MAPLTVEVEDDMESNVKTIMLRLRAPAGAGHDARWYSSSYSYNYCNYMYSNLYILCI